MKDMLDDMPDDKLRRKLQNFSEDPDPGLWEEINKSVRSSLSVHERLKSYTENPDEVVWNSVQSRLVYNDFLLWLDWSGRAVAAVALLMLLIPLYKTNKSVLVQHTTVQYENKTKVQDETVTESDLFTQNRNKEIPAPSVPLSSVVDSPVTSKTIDRTYNSDNGLDENEGVPELTKSFGIVSEFNEGGIVSQKDGNKNYSYRDMDEPVVPNKSDTTHTVISTIVQVDTVANNSVTSGKEKKHIHKLNGLYALVMPTLGYHQISPVTDDNILIEAVEKVGTFSMKRLGVRAEIGFEKPVHDRWTLNVGVLYFQRKQAIGYRYRDTERFDIKQQEGDTLLFEAELEPLNATFNYEVKNIGVIAGASYSIQGKKLNQRLGVAAEFHRGLNKPNSEISTGQSYYLFGDVYYRLSYPISSKVELLFQPTFNYALQLDERINAPFYVKPYGMGLNLGAYLKL